MRRAMFRLDSRLFREILKFPENVSLIGVSYDAMTDSFMFVIESPDFPEVHPSNTLTQCRPTYGNRHEPYFTGFVF